MDETKKITKFFQNIFFSPPCAKIAKSNLKTVVNKIKIYQPQECSRVKGKKQDPGFDKQTNLFYL